MNTIESAFDTFGDERYGSDLTGNAVARAWKKVRHLPKPSGRTGITVTTLDKDGEEKDVYSVDVPNDLVRPFVAELLKDPKVGSIAYGKANEKKRDRF